MFEGKPPIAYESRSSATGVVADEALRELRWSDLVARLAASRDLRAELAREDEIAFASFDADSARRLALQHDGLRHDANQFGVNPDDSGNGKSACGTSLHQHNHQAPVVRGNQ